MEIEDSRIEFQVLDLMDGIRYFFCIVEDSHGDDYRTTGACGGWPRSGFSDLGILGPQPAISPGREKTKIAQGRGFNPGNRS